MTDFKKSALIVAEFAGSLAVVFAAFMFVTWGKDISTLEPIDRALMLWLALGLFVMLEIRRIK